MLDLNNHNHNPNKTTTKKKRVPDWLNASIWYSPPPLPHSDSDFDFDIHGYPTAPPQPPPTPPPPPPPPPPSTRTNNPSSHTDYPSTSESPSLSPDDIARHSHLLVEMSKKVINMKEVRRLASFSLPDAPSSSSLRSSLWKLLLGYLPPERTLWPLHLTNKRTQYKQLKDDLFLTPSEITRRLHKFDSPIHPLDHKGATRHPLPRSHIPPSEHPLTLIQSSVWHKFFQDAEILEQIDRDVKRTHPDIQFFSGDTSLAKSTQDAMRNILIVFAKLNPGIRYVQGMNEILAPLFYVFCNDPDDTNAAAAEADTFFCFSELLSGFRDNFCQQLDNSVVGIRSTITKLSLLLKEHDEELWRHLEVTCKINPEFYGFRWITLLLTQEFSFTDILHIWDALLSDPEAPQETLLRICCAMLILVRRRLLAGDFTSNLKLLQHYPSTTNITHLLYVAHKLRAHPSS